MLIRECVALRNENQRQEGKKCQHDLARRCLPSYLHDRESRASRIITSARFSALCWRASLTFPDRASRYASPFVLSRKIGSRSSRFTRRRGLRFKGPIKNETTWKLSWLISLKVIQRVRCKTGNPSKMIAGEIKPGSPST